MAKRAATVQLTSDNFEEENEEEVSLFQNRIVCKLISYFLNRM